MKTAQDPNAAGWRSEYTVAGSQGTTIRQGVVRTGAFTTAQDAEILAVAEIIGEANQPTTIHTSTSGPAETLREATTSLGHAEQIKKAVRQGRARVEHRPDVSIQEDEEQGLRDQQPEPTRYTSQAYVQAWIDQREAMREHKQLEDLPDSYKKA